LEVLAAQRCGVAASRKTTSSRDKAEKGHATLAAAR
jgi:hypothetical protein